MTVLKHKDLLANAQRRERKVTSVLGEMRMGQGSLWACLALFSEFNGCC